MPQEPATKHLIVYADDDADDQFFVQEAFEKLFDSVEVLTFADGVEILSYLQAFPQHQPTPCLIILDINMPRMNGKEVLLQLRQTERYKQIPVVLFTTSSRPNDKEFAKENNIGLLTKPVEYREMENIAKQLITYCEEQVKRALEARFPINSRNQ